MTPKLDSERWIDANFKGRDFAFFVRGGHVWVRYNGGYKRASIDGYSSILETRELAAVIAGESHHWMDEAAALKAGLPAEQHGSSRSAPQPQCRPE